MTSGRRAFPVKEIIGTIISVILAVIFSITAFRGIDLNAFLSTLSKVSLWWVFIFALSTTYSHYLRAVRWKVLLSEIKPDVSSHHSFAAVMIGYGINNVIPRLGEVSRALFLGQYEGISRVSILGSIVIERMLDIICFGLSILIAGLVYSGNIYIEFPWLKTTFVIGIAMFFVFIFFLYSLMKHKHSVERFIFKPLVSMFPSMQSFLDKVIAKLLSGLTGLANPRIAFKAAALSVLIMLNYGVTSYFGFFMIDAQTLSGITPTFSMAWVLMSISAIGVMIPTPGGIGSYHTITRAAMFTLFAIPNHIGVVYAVLSHGISYVLNIILGLVYFFSFRRRYGVLDESAEAMVGNGL